MKTIRILTITDTENHQYTTQRDDWKLSDAIAGAMEHYPFFMKSVAKIEVEIVNDPR